MLKVDVKPLCRVKVKYMQASRKKRVDQTRDFLKERITTPCEVGFLTGTGLSESTRSIDITAEIDYADILNFPVSTVESHTGRLVSGKLGGRVIIAMQGRFHLYEGYAPFDVTFPVRVMQALGVKYLILSNASGGINLNFAPGDIMIIKDHINLTGQNPLTGPNEESWGIRFPDMTAVYDKALAGSARQGAEKLNIRVRKGVYTGLPGPSLETPAETRFLKTIGGDAVGFSTVLEAIAGVHAGMKILGLSAITNINNPDDPEKAFVDDIIAVARQTSGKIDALVAHVVKNL